MDIPITAWKWLPESGGEIRIVGTRDGIHISARSQFAAAAPAVALTLAEAKQLIETLRKMTAPMARPNAAA